jgi:hypothetical protein
MPRRHHSRHPGENGRPCTRHRLYNNHHVDELLESEERGSLQGSPAGALNRYYDGEQGHLTQ